MTAIRLRTTVAQAGHALYPNGERHLRPIETLQAALSAGMACRNLDVVERCRFSLDDLRYEYPEEIVPAGETPTTYLRSWPTRVRTPVQPRQEVRQEAREKVRS